MILGMFVIGPWFRIAGVFEDNVCLMKKFGKPKTEKESYVLVSYIVY